MKGRASAPVAAKPSDPLITERRFMMLMAVLLPRWPDIERRTLVLQATAAYRFGQFFYVWTVLLTECEFTMRPRQPPDACSSRNI
jgi:hypothetical protein